jgi:hypothetical protein
VWVPPGCGTVNDQAVCERDWRGGIFAVIEILSVSARVARSAVYSTKGECVHAVASEGRKDVPRILVLFGIQHTILHQQ